jgi:hypothetical protein
VSGWYINDFIETLQLIYNDNDNDDNDNDDNNSGGSDGSDGINELRKLASLLTAQLSPLTPYTNGSGGGSGGSTAGHIYLALTSVARSGSVSWLSSPQGLNNPNPYSSNSSSGSGGGGVQLCGGLFSSTNIKSNNIPTTNYNNSSISGSGSGSGGGNGSGSIEIAAPVVILLSITTAQRLLNNSSCSNSDRRIALKLLMHTQQTILSTVKSKNYVCDTYYNKKE